MLAIYLFELRYLLKRPATWVYFSILFLLGFFFMTTDAVQLGGGIGKVMKNAPYVISQSIVILTFVGSIITTALAGTAILRDSEMQVDALYFTTPLAKAQYLLGRFLGAYTIMLLVYAAAPLGLLIGSWMPWLDATKIGPTNLWAYGHAFLVFIVPNVFVISALFFTVGTLSKNMFAVYVQGILLFVLYGISSIIVRGLENTHIASAMDLYGIRSFFFETRYWTVFEKNTQIVPIGSYLLVNRVLWLAVGMLSLGLCYSFFRFAVGASASRKKNDAENELQGAPGSLRLPAVRQHFDRAYRWSSFSMLIRTLVKSITRDKLFLALAVIGMINTLFAAYNADTLFGTTVYPVTYLMLDTLSGFSFFILLISTFYGGELVWRDRRYRVANIVDALPLPTWVGYVSKIIALSIAQLIVIAALFVAGMMIQLSKGYYHLELGLYATEFLTNYVFKVVMMSLFTVTVHSIVNNKYLGHFFAVAIWVLVLVFPTMKIDHLLTQFMNQSTAFYSDMNGFGPYVPRQISMTTYWVFFCALCAWIAYLLTARGVEDSFLQRLRFARVRTSSATMVMGAFLVIGVLGSGGFVYYNTNILNKRITDDDSRHESALFEKRYQHFEHGPQPHVIATSLNVDLVPEELRYTAEGDYVLRNTFDQPIDTVMINLNDDKVYDDLRFDRASQTISDDKETGVQLVVLHPALQPKDSCRFHFHMSCANKGFRNGAMNTSIAYNGSFISNDVFPHIGYSADVEISDEDDRKKEGLGPKERMPNIDDTLAHKRNYISDNTDWMRYQITISTAPDQIAISPGYLQKEWNAAGRRYFSYVMDAPILGFYSLLSARYEVKRDSVDGIRLEIYYNKGHEYNLETMIKGMKQSLQYCAKNYAPYQFRQLRILEFPRYATFAQSFPNTVPYSEAIGFIARVKSDEDVDYPFYVTAHETAHQWWGHQVVGASVQGATMLSESFAEYTALMVMKHEYGAPIMKKFLKFALNSYLRGRGSERSKELPLYINENQQYLHYNKGSLVLYALADYIGEDSLNAALSRFCQRFRLRPAPYPTTKDFLADLHQVVPDSLQYLVRDWFETITLYDNRIREASYSHRADGLYDVRLTVESKKFLADSLGEQKDMPLHDYIDIGVFDAQDDPRTKLGKALVMNRVLMTQAKQTFTFTVSTKPEKAGIDPYNKLIDRDAEDNVMSVSEQ